MIQPNSMLEALQRGLYGLGGIGTALQDKKKDDAALAQAAATKASTEAGTANTVADTAAKELAKKQAAVTFHGALKTSQILDSLDTNEAETKQLQSAGPQAAQDPLNGAAGPLLPGQERIPATPGVLSDKGTARLQTMPKEHASLLAQLARWNGDPMATPELMQAKYGSGLTQAKNAGTLSNQAVAAGQQGVDTGALGLATAKATQGADIADKNLAPTKTRAGIGLIGAQTNEANAKAAKEKDLQKAEGANTDNLAKGLTTGDVTWDDFKSLMASRGAEGSAARLAVYNKAMALDPTFNPSEMEKSWKAYSNPANQKAVAQIENVKPNLDRLIDLSNQISRSGMPAVNKLIMLGKYQIGDRAVTNFKEMQHALADEIGTALSGSGQMTDAKLKLAQDMLQASPSDENYASNIKLIGHMLDTRKESIAKPMGVYAKRLIAPTVTADAPAGQPAAAGSPASAGPVDKKALAQQAITDPEATPEEKAAAKRILGL
jgi:hypothetical protein